MSQPVYLLTAAILAATTCLGGCATSSETLVSPAAASIHLKSAYVVTHGNRSSNMDASIQKALVRRGIEVSSGQSESPVGPSDVVVKYSDAWRWDLTMYLRRLEIQFYDTQTGRMLVSGSWKNSALHGYHGAEGVVDDTIDAMCQKLEASK